MSSDDVSALGQETAETRGGDTDCACCGQPFRIEPFGPRDPDPWDGRMDDYCYQCALARCDTSYPGACPAHPRSEAEGCATEAALAEAERQRDEARLSSRSFWKLSSGMWEKRARAAEAALADTREALRNLLAWADETVEAIAKEYSDYTDDETAPLEAARVVLAAVPPRQGAPADTDARPAHNAGTRGGDA